MPRKEPDHAMMQAKMAVDAAIKRVGKNGWELFSPAMREAFVCREIAGLILTQIPSTLEKLPELRHYHDTIRCAFDILDPEETS